MSRSFKMSNDVYAAMLARGFSGEMRTYSAYRMTTRRLAAARRHRCDGGGDPRRRAAVAEVTGSANRGDQTAASAPPPDAEPVYRLRGVRYSYPGGHLALDGIDLDIERGERVACWAPTGAASRRCSSCSTASWPRARGRCRRSAVTSRPWSRGQDAFRFHREVGLVFQDPDIQLFSATVFDDVAFGPLQLGHDPGRGPRTVRRGARPDGDRPPGGPRPVRALGRREEAGGDRVGALAAPRRDPARRADGRARPADEVGPRRT